MMRQSLSASSPARRNWRRFASKPKILSKKFSRRGILFVVSAPSGAGKTTLVERIRRTPNLFYSVSCTTRTPRAGEIDGQDYRFLSDADFRERVAKGDFVEHAQVHGDHYGTLREPIVTNLETAKGRFDRHRYARRCCDSQLRRSTHPRCFGRCILSCPPILRNCGNAC